MISLPRIAVGAFAALIVLFTSLTRLAAADVSSYGVAKGVLFAQTNAGAPQLRDGFPFIFQAVAVPVSSGLTSASMQWALGTRFLAPRFSGAPATSTDRQPTQELLDLFYPSGNFTVSMTTVNDGSPSGVLGLTGDNYPPNAPSVVNYNLAQAINASNDFTLRWSAFLGGTVNDFIYVQIDAATGQVFRTSQSPGTLGALSGTNTSLIIPSNTLASGRGYAARIRFHKTSGTNSTAYPGVTGAASYFTQTDFFLSTAGAGDITPPRLISINPPNGATNVPVNTPVVMTFDEPMRGGLSFFFSGPSAVRTFAWSPDGRTLVTTPSTTWPPGAVLSWVLNPSDGPLLYGDVNRTPVAPETWFRFTTGTNTVPAPAPMLSEARRSVTGRFDFKLSGETGWPYAAEVSTNLTNWTSLGTNVVFGGSVQFIDTNAPGSPHRFYRGFAP